MKFVKQDASISALVPGQGPLLHRACVEEHKIKFRTWFFSVEDLAWKWANTFGRERPNKIFGVSGQTLTNEYSIAHHQGNSSECEILVEPNISIPKVAEVSSVLGHQCRKASASIGFNDHRSGDDSSMYSVFFEVIESGPMNFLPYSRKTYPRIEAAFR